jgi:hypothetical protein
MKQRSLTRSPLGFSIEQAASRRSDCYRLQKDGVDFVAADMPDANRLTVGILALAAEHEAKAISERTKAALAAAKARGVKLGGDRGGAPASLRKLAAPGGKSAERALTPKPPTLTMCHNPRRNSLALRHVPLLSAERNL